MKTIEEIIAHRLDVDISHVTDDKHLSNDLGSDSLQMVELVMEIEEEFNIEILDEDVDGLTTVKGMKEYVLERAGV